MAQIKREQKNYTEVKQEETRPNPTICTRINEAMIGEQRISIPPLPMNPCANPLSEEVKVQPMVVMPMVPLIVTHLEEAMQDDVLDTLRSPPSGETNLLNVTIHEGQ